MPYILRQPGERVASTQKISANEMRCSVTALRKASRRVTQLYDDALAGTGLRSTQLAILHELAPRAEKPPTMAELAEVLVIERSALGHTLRPLERDGLIVLQEGEDRRQRHVVLTPKGKAKYREGARAWQLAQDRFDEVFGPAEASTLRATLLNIAYDERLSKLKD
jgi:DNA-binding MarR family transcriptional regulator